MIHNHEVESSSLSLATKALRNFEVLFFVYVISFCYICTSKTPRVKGNLGNLGNLGKLGRVAYIAQDLIPKLPKI